MSIAASEPSDALREQVKTDAGPHATPDQLRAAEKRRAAMGGVRSAEPEQRHAPEAGTTARKKAAKK